MHWRYCRAALVSFVATSQARPVSEPIPRSEKAVSLASSSELGDIRSETTYVKRDLGFQGQIGQYILLTYGDTLYTDQLNSNTFQGMVSNSAAFATYDPTVVFDPDLDETNHPRQFVNLNPAWNESQSFDAVGITNVIPTTSNNGLVFTLANHRPNGVNHIIGAGIATVSLNTTVYPPIPTATRLFRSMWDGTTEPWYGDVCALKANDGYVYAYGHKGDGNPWVYLARAQVDHATDISSYEYWHGTDQGWTTTRLIDPHLNETQSVFWQVSQGQVFWSPRFNRYLFIYCDAFWSATVLLRSATSPEGPWSDAKTIYEILPKSSVSSFASPSTVSAITPASTATSTPATDPGAKPQMLYAAIPHPYYDPSGKTLVITFTNYPNAIQAVRITFA